MTVAQADGRRLEWDAQQVLFRVVSDTTGVMWESGHDFEHLDEYSKRNRRLLTTLLQINYLDASGAEASPEQHRQRGVYRGQPIEKRYGAAVHL